MDNLIYCTSCGAQNPANAHFCHNCGSVIHASSILNNPESDFITLACPNCGGKLEITSGTDRFKCNFCGHEHLVRRSGNDVTLSPVIEGLQKVVSKIDQAIMGSDRQAAEQTITRLKNEVPAIQDQIKEKEKWLQTFAANEKKSKNKRRSGLFLTIYGFFLIMFFVIYSIQCSATPSYCNSSSTRAIFGISGLFIVVIGVVLLIKKDAGKTNANKTQSELVSSELSQLKQTLQNHLASIEELNQFTTKR
jgi:hypothetical protein